MPVYSVSLADLDKLEHTIAQQNNRPSLDLINRIAPHEKIIFCLYDQHVVGWYFGLINPKPDISFWILTDFRLIYCDYSASADRFKELMLNRLFRTNAISGLLNDAIISIYKSPDVTETTFSLGDKNAANYMVAELNKAISQSKVRVQPTVVNFQSTTPPTESIVDQIKSLSVLRDSGVITEDEFVRAKQRIIGL